MVFDSHLHLIRKANFDMPLWEAVGIGVPEDTDVRDLVGWLRESGVERAVVMGQDMTRIWNTNFGEDYVLECVRRFPEFFVGLCSIEPLDKFDRFNQAAFDYFEKAVSSGEFRGVLMTPPYGHYYSNDRRCYPFYEEALRHNAVVQFHHSAQIGPPVFAPPMYANLFNLEEVMIDFARLTIVVEHIGYPWCEHLFVLMASNQNLWADLAMMTDRPIYTCRNLVIAKEFGVIDRIMYASDYVSRSFAGYSAYPAQDFARYIRFIDEGLNRVCRDCGWPAFTDGEIEGLRGGNAARLYGLTVA